MKENDTKDLKQIAKDMYAGKIFCDRQISNAKDIPMVFMPIMFMKKEELEKQDIYFIYEYLSEAGPRSINGMPMFTSCYFLNKENFEKMMGYYEAVKIAMDSI